MNSDGSDPHQLTTTAPTTTGGATVTNTWPRWSPNGEWIAFQSNVIGNSTQIYVIRPNGLDLKPITLASSGVNQFPAWSPDGTRLTVRRNADIVVLDMGWLPDGLLLVASDRTTTTELIGVAIRNGTVEGAPELLKADIGRTSPLGVTTAGALFYSTGLETCCGSIQVAEFDPRSGRVTSRRDVSTNLQENMSTRVGHRMASTSLTFRYVIGRAARESS